MQLYFKKKNYTNSYGRDLQNKKHKTKWGVFSTFFYKISEKIKSTFRIPVVNISFFSIKKNYTYFRK